MKKIFVAVFAAVALVLTGCGITDDDLADPSFQTLRYEGGVTQGSKFKECVDVGSKLASDDKFYRYPTTQREDVWDSSNYNRGSKSADHKDMVVNVNGTDMSVKVKIQFFLNTDCSPVTVDGKRYPGGVIQAFHERIGKTRHAYFNSDGSYENGWLWAMDNYISSSAAPLMQREVKKYDPEKSWQDGSLWPVIAEAVEKDLQAAVDSSMETDLQFYKHMKVKVFGIEPDSNFKSLYQERKTADVRAKTAEANRAAQVAEANAKAAVAEAEAKVRQAEMRGAGGPENYARLRAIDKGLNPWQPTYLVNSTK